MPKAEQELSARFGRPERLTDCLARGGEVFAEKFLLKHYNGVFSVWAEIRD